MSSPPSPATSTRAASLHTPVRKHRERSSFPSVAALNPFRKKASPKPTEFHPPIEPYEVAPGIWNTDATAKVFGYLELSEKTDKQKSKTLEPGVWHPSRIPNRKPVPDSDFQDINKKALHKIGTAIIKPCPPQITVEVPDHISKGQTGEVHRSLPRVWKQGGKPRMRTVSKDDQLIQRGANPRTGLVSPFVTSDSSDDNFGRDYVAMSNLNIDIQPLPKGRVRSGKWRQHRVGWSLVESPLLSPITQSTGDHLSRKVSVKEIEDKLLVEMPGVDNPEPSNMTDLQMQKYQDGIARAYKHGGSNAMVKPETLPTPRQSTPDGPSSPPNKLHRIRRKMVKSGQSCTQQSDNTVIVDAQTPVFPVHLLGSGSKEMQRDSNITPSRTSKGSSMEARSKSRNVDSHNAFLDKTNEKNFGQKTKWSQCPRPQISPQQGIYQKTLDKPESLSKAGLVDLPASPTLSQRLPRVQFQHPSHFATLESSSCHRPVLLLPERLRAPEQRRGTLESACTITITSTLSQRQKTKQRPEIHRQNANEVISGMIQSLPGKHETTKEAYLQVGTIRKKTSSAIKPMAGTSHAELKESEALPHQGQSISELRLTELRPQPVAFQQKLSNHQKVSNPEAEHGARVAMIDNCRSLCLQQFHQREKPILTSVTQGLDLGSTNNVQGYEFRDLRSGVGIIPTCGPRGKKSAESGVERFSHKHATKIKYEASKEPFASMDIDFESDGCACFVGQPLNRLQSREKDSIIVRHEDPVERKRYLLTKAMDAGLHLTKIQGPWASSIKLGHIVHRLYHMVCHILRTLHPTSPAMLILRTPELKAQDYLYAAKEFILACSYLLVLLKVALAVRKMVILLAVLLFWLWHPTESLLAIFKWLMMA